MTRLKSLLCVAVLVLASACGSDDGGAQGTAKPTATPKAYKEGGVRKMGEFIKTAAGSRVVITKWTIGAPKRDEAAGPGQQYQSIGVGFCPGPTVDVTGRQVVPLFSLELPGGDRISPDSATGKDELRAKGQIDPGECVLLPVVFQVGGGRKPDFVVFRTTNETTKWKVP